MNEIRLNHIDTDYCQKQGIKVINFPGFNSRAVAEMAFANLISLLRKSDLRLQEMVNSQNVILTPHIAWNTKEALERLEKRALNALKKII